MRLVFLESILPPVIPLDQCYFFANASRRQLYSENNYKATADLALAFYEDHEHSRAHHQEDDTSNEDGQHKRGPSHQSNARTLLRKDSNGIRNSNNNNAGPSSGSDGVSIIPNIVSEEAVTALAEAAGVVGRYSSQSILCCHFIFPFKYMVWVIIRVHFSSKSIILCII